MKKKMKKAKQKFDQLILKIFPDIFCVNCVLVFVIYLMIILLVGIATTIGLGGGPLSLSNPDSFLSKIGSFISSFEALPLIIILLPILGGPLEAIIGKKSSILRDTLVVNTTFITFILIVLMYPQVMRGGLSFSLPGVLGFGLNFNVDILSYILAITSGILWLFVSIYAHDYMDHEKHQNRFFLWKSITFGGVLGTLMAGDLFTMFLFFEIMTFSSYVLVAHNQSNESMLAGNSYIFIGVVGGLSILLGMLMLYAYTGTLEFVPLASQLAAIGWPKYIMVGLFVIGFGIKAGMLPLHIWLPKAHPVAPTPASALLSGILIKIGAYGLLRLTISVFMPNPQEITGFLDPLWDVSRNLGVMIIWAGIITMAVGAFLALQQCEMKKLLAYSSISQIGYIIMGVGVTAYLGYMGAMGYAGTLYHIINHAFFKSLLFMVAGVVFYQTNELNMFKLGGLWKKLPLTALLCLIAIMGIIGMPLFNGFISKSLLHHGIVEAYEYGHASFKYAELIFRIVSIGTVAYYMKFFISVFLGELPEKFKNIGGEKGMMDLAMGGLALLIIAIGHVPHFLMDRFIIPSARALTYDPAFIKKYLVDIEFFTYSEISGMFWIFVFGILLYIAGTRFKLFQLTFYECLDIDKGLYKPMYNGVVSISRKFTEKFEDKIINNDVVIYSAILMVIMFFLLWFT
jgi:formate hydrogenlyase subunit 3/multisubunit Na+/H+ antiporter MnhD subunit